MRERNEYNITVGHTGLARLCLAHWCYRTRTKLTEVREAPASIGGGGCHNIMVDIITGLIYSSYREYPTLIFSQERMCYYAIAAA